MEECFELQRKLYLIPGLPTGRYKVEVEYPGLETVEITGFTLVVAQESRADVAMRPGGVTQTINVTAGAPQVDTESDGVKGTVPREFIDQLPLIDRDVRVLETTQAGAVTDPTSGGRMLSVDGSRPGHTGFQLDGMSVNNIAYTQLQTTRRFPVPMRLKSSHSLPMDTKLNMDVMKADRSLLQRVREQIRSTGPRSTMCEITL